MKVEKETRKLGIEELERRAAPVIVDVGGDEAPAPSEPTSPSDGGASSGPAPVDQPGNSDVNRAKIWHENQ